VCLSAWQKATNKKEFELKPGCRCIKEGHFYLEMLDPIDGGGARGGGERKRDEDSGDVREVLQQRSPPVTASLCLALDRAHLRAQRGEGEVQGGKVSKVEALRQDLLKNAEILAIVCITQVKLAFVPPPLPPPTSLINIKMVKMHIKTFTAVSASVFVSVSMSQSVSETVFVSVSVFLSISVSISISVCLCLCLHPEKGGRLAGNDL